MFGSRLLRVLLTFDEIRPEIEFISGRHPSPYNTIL